ncbi:hypothetical protein ACPXCG_07320 [Gordonia sp. DT218]|uniref:8-oxoguanine DNA glycosylase OGG fold protein n=1 Tax=unclassified Gordonia (in: high G+C Gram-positive bacteria) TaxID=2657482 RepID=UPI003CE8228E
MSPRDLAPPTILIDWLAAGDRTTELLDDTVGVDRPWWAEQLAEHGLPGVLCGETISRTGLFGLADAALASPDDAINLLWNTIAFCHGRRPGENKRRMVAVATDRRRIGGLLQEAAQASREDPATAFELLKPERGGNTIERLGPTGFTWFLYFAGGGAPDHPSQVLDSKIARTIRRAGWKRFPVSAWTADDYVGFGEVVARWRTESGAARNDVIVRGLYSVSPPADADYPWQTWERETWKSDNWVNGPLSTDDLRQIYHWLALIADVYPMSTAAADFARIGPTISRALDGDLGPTPRLRPPGESSYDDPFLLYNGRGSTPISRQA